MAYFDTSAFVKLFVDEPGSSEASEIWASARLPMSSRLLYPEARAALAAAVRSGRAGSRSHALREKLDALARDVAYIEVTSSLAMRAGDLADEYGLRGYDAVHLASCESVDDDVVLVAADGELLSAARRNGLATLRVSG
ncbi:MAG: type II toxin-antitoxin system VapC family toxin [Gaiellaceae bacterium]|nr:type II toxin-antitoxin system VapC family toxin [Gaiellaceae bacterium]